VTNSQIRASYWMTFPLTIVNFNHFFIQPAPDDRTLYVNHRVAMKRNILRLYKIVVFCICICSTNLLVLSTIVHYAQIQLYWIYIYIYISYLPAARSGWEKLCPKSWKRREPEGRGTFSRPRAQFFSSGPTLPVNNAFIFYQM
jgi:hypothetical protein